MASDILSILVFVSLIAVVAGSAATYQGSPAGKKWRCVIPIAAFIIVGLGTAFVTGLMTGRKMIDVETSRMVMIGALVVVTIFCSVFFFKHR
jgi:hypothetical protein